MTPEELDLVPEPEKEEPEPIAVAYGDAGKRIEKFEGHDIERMCIASVEGTWAREVFDWPSVRRLFVGVPARPLGFEAFSANHLVERNVLRIYLRKYADPMYPKIADRMRAVGEWLDSLPLLVVLE